MDADDVRHAVGVDVGHVERGVEVHLRHPRFPPEGPETAARTHTDRLKRLSSTAAHMRAGARIRGRQRGHMAPGQGRG